MGFSTTFVTPIMDGSSAAMAGRCEIGSASRMPSSRSNS